ncbi:hypothetical protein [Acinetobacter sp. ANC 4805]|uniref:hypothetical protein n=1 Tax=Acinetobacter sp. ANC 4805 TaxID=2923425 RepID=UPI001F4A691C|nr:hypothetical protein [Acinetobacter sp. ANC 4805]MCH7310547.1 hypothetical protein [Acinetobacter sp. ANC 4805]
MLKSVNLPLYNDFLKIFVECEIVNWQAKHFWEKIKFNQNYRTNEDKRLMYVGLKILLKCEYLEVDVNKSSKRAFSYNETPRLNELRDRYKKKKLEPIFSIKRAKFLNEIDDKENNIKFIESLILDDKTLEKYFINYREKLKNDIRNINSNIKLMDEILNK